MSASFGVNLRVTGHCSRGGRKYMEDYFSVAYQEFENKKDLEYAFIGIYDGHGGAEASKFARQHLIKLIVSQKLFWSESDEEILQAIREGFIATHYAMWREQAKWPKTNAGLPSTAGTTASVAFIRNGKIYIGHLGDSGIVLGYTEEDDETNWRAMPLTREHKPECPIEKERIARAGGKVVVKSNVPRVVWNRPKIGHKGPVRRSTPIDEIPFLAVARSLGDFWSYNATLNKFVVSPDPDVRVIKINPKRFRCLIFGTDGLWNVISANSSVEIVRYAEQINEQNTYTGEDRDWTNPSKCLVDKALEHWSTTRTRADNTSVVIVMIDPPGPPKREVVKQCPQQFIVENSPCQEGEEEGVVQPVAEVITNPELNNYTMFDHRTNELTELEKIAQQDRTIGNMSHYNGASTDHDYGLDDESACLSSTMTFESTYAAAYNPMIHPLADDPTEPPVKDEPYSLICLETGTTTTATDLYHSTYPMTDASTEHAQPLPQHQPTDYEPPQAFFSDQYQFESITSSFLSQSCGIMQDPLDDSVQAALMNNIPKTPDIPAHLLAPIEKPQEPEDTSPIDDDDTDESMTGYLEEYTRSSTDLLEDTDELCDASTPRPDDSIQIAEISSSSKENEVTSFHPYRLPMLRSTKKSMMRMTRSSKLPRTPSFDSRTKKPKTIAKKAVAAKPSPKCPSSVVPSRVSARCAAPTSAATRPSRRSSISNSSKRGSLRTSLDMNKRTLRSKNTFGFKAKSSSSSSSVAKTTKQAKAPVQPLKPAPTTKPSPATQTPTTSNDRTSRLRDKVRSSYQKLVAIVSSERSNSTASTTPKRSRFRKRLSR